MRALLSMVTLLLLASTAAQAQVPAAITRDPPVDGAHRAVMAVVHIPTHGLLINGVLYEAAGAGPHPTMVLLHGLPGNEQNLDLAQAVRRAGWNVLTLHYRGSWGSPGAFSFTHVFEDAQAALDFIRSPANVKTYAVDPRRLVVAGHSMGGMAASIVGANDPTLAGVAMISAANFAMFGPVQGAREKAELEAFMADNRESLAGVTPAMMADEAARNAARWDFTSYAQALARHPLLLVTSDDGLAPASDALARAVKTDKGAVTQVRLATDHSYSDARIALETAVVDWLANLPPAAAGVARPS